MNIEAAANLPELKAIVQKSKRFDLVFSILGFLALLLAVMTFVVLFAQMAITGWERISPEFFTNFPSRRAGSAGILSALVGSI